LETDIEVLDTDTAPLLAFKADAVVDVVVVVLCTAVSVCPDAVVLVLVVVLLFGCCESRRT